MNRSFWLDKIIDGVFIFFGVYFAFHFDQFQQDRASERELHFNIGAIMKHLPTRKPLRYIAPFKVDVEESATGGCSFQMPDNFQSSTSGRDFVDLIKRRGLARFIEKQTVLNALTVYYSEIIPDFVRLRNVFDDKVREVMTRILSSTNKGDGKSFCTNPSWKRSVERELSKIYLEAMVADKKALTMGHFIRGELEKIGFKSEKKVRQQLEVFFELADTPDKLKMIEDFEAESDIVIPKNSENEASAKEKKTGAEQEVPNQL